MIRKIKFLDEPLMGVIGKWTENLLKISEKINKKNYKFFIFSQKWKQFIRSIQKIFTIRSNFHP